mmetsp:Transcript_4188/g.18631  ORF Transcript_4188/g.18631 Transcript_4188/m.18631 type:complete len:255 (-) Transcript_4188:1758-2522(-)
MCGPMISETQQCALHTVEEILADTLAAPAHVAERAVIHGVAAVVPQVAYRAEIFRNDDRALATLLRRRLPRSALHAYHLIGCVSVDGVVLDIIVAEPADVRGTTASSHQSNLPSVVLASEDRVAADRLARHDVIAALVIADYTGRAREGEGGLSGVRKWRPPELVGAVSVGASLTIRSAIYSSLPPTVAGDVVAFPTLLSCFALCCAQIHLAARRCCIRYALHSGARDSSRESVRAACSSCWRFMRNMSSQLGV